MGSGIYVLSLVPSARHPVFPATNTDLGRRRRFPCKDARRGLLRLGVVGRLCPFIHALLFPPSTCCVACVFTGSCFTKAVFMISPATTEGWALWIPGIDRVLHTHGLVGVIHTVLPRMTMGRYVSLKLRLYSFIAGTSPLLCLRNEHND